MTLFTLRKSAMIFISAALIIVSCNSCSTDGPVTPDTPQTTVGNTVSVPAFNQDSAYAFVKTQVDFGPRVPTTAQHKACGDWMVAKLKSYGANVIEQTGNVTTFDGKTFPLRNIIGEFNPSAKKRIVLAAHWDTRPFADKDPDKSLWKKPIDGANDGGSGVGVLLEIARLISIQAPKMGVDIVFFDAEDYGVPEFNNSNESSDTFTWCLGSQYWMRNPHKTGYNAECGILLDMVGADGAIFNKEGKSMERAMSTVAQVWNIAAKFGYGSLFVDNETGEIVDDHQFMNAAGIPTIDIIDMRPEIKAMGMESYGFGSFHHTHNDNMSVISTNTLKAVGHTVSHFIYTYR